MKNRPPGPAGLKALEKTVVIKGGPQLPNRAPVAPAKGAPVPPPPLWNYEGKPLEAKAEAPKSPPAGGEASTKAASDANAPEGSASAKPVDAELEVEEMLAVMETNAALAELDEHIAALEDLVSRLPE